MVWSPELKATMTDWATRISRRSTQHILSARYYGRYGDLLMYLSIIFGLGSGFSDFMNDKCASVVKYLSGSMAILSGILVSIVKFSNLVGRSEKHRASASEYSVLFRKIQMQLATSADLRQDGTEFAASIIKEFQTIQTGAPLISESVERDESRLFHRHQKRPPIVYTSTTSENDRTGHVPNVLFSATTTRAAPSALNTDEPRYPDPPASLGDQNALEDDVLTGALQDARNEIRRAVPTRRRESLQMTKYPRYIHDNPTAVPIFTSEDLTENTNSDEEEDTDSA